MEIGIRKVSRLNRDELDELRDESVREGFRFIQRLIDDYSTGVNRFDQEGESLFLCYAHEKVVGVCGLNREEARGDRTIGRLRRFYVLPEHRRNGIGRKLVAAVLADARGYFDIVQLRTATASADRFYRRLGFEAVDGAQNVTHRIMLEAFTTEAGE